MSEDNKQEIVGGETAENKENKPDQGVKDTEAAGGESSYEDKGEVMPGVPTGAEVQAAEPSTPNH